MNRGPRHDHCHQRASGRITGGGQLGPSNMAKVWRKEPTEEMQHADRITDRINFLEGFPNMQCLIPCGSPERQGNHRLRPRRRNESACALPRGGGDRHSVKDDDDRDLFENLMMDEAHDVDPLETKLILINLVGLNLPSRIMFGGLKDRRSTVLRAVDGNRRGDVNNDVWVDTVRQAVSMSSLDPLLIPIMHRRSGAAMGDRTCQDCHIFNVSLVSMKAN